MKASVAVASCDKLPCRPSGSPAKIPKKGNFKIDYSYSVVFMVCYFVINLFVYCLSIFFSKTMLYVGPHVGTTFLIMHHRVVFSGSL